MLVHIYGPYGCIWSIPKFWVKCMINFCVLTKGLFFNTFFYEFFFKQSSCFHLISWSSLKSIMFCLLSFTINAIHISKVILWRYISSLEKKNIITNRLYHQVILILSWKLHTAISKSTQVIVFYIWLLYVNIRNIRPI